MYLEALKGPTDAHAFLETSEGETALDLSPEENRADLIRATTGHVIEKAEITGIYDPRVD